MQGMGPLLWFDHPPVWKAGLYGKIYYHGMSGPFAQLGQGSVDHEESRSVHTDVSGQ